MGPCLWFWFVPFLFAQFAMISMLTLARLLTFSNKNGFVTALESFLAGNQHTEDGQRTYQIATFKILKVVAGKVYKR